jgi:hypothetical protein
MRRVPGTRPGKNKELRIPTGARSRFAECGVVPRKRGGDGVSEEPDNAAERRLPGVVLAAKAFGSIRRGGSRCPNGRGDGASRGGIQQ